MWGDDEGESCGAEGDRLIDRIRTTRRRLLGAVAAGGAAAGLGTAATDRTDEQRSVADRAADGVEPTLIEADSDAGFEHPYYLYAPPGIDRSPVSILVEPVNSGTPSDDFQEDLDQGEDLVTRGKPRQIADALGMPLVVPVFPNPRTGEHGDAFTQYLDVETMQIDDGPLARIDRQTLAMADHAAGVLAEAGITADPASLALNGFSASGNFVNKLAALHPDRVSSLTAGAVNGTAILPLERAKGHRLPYQIGVADFESLIGESFDPAAWREVDQLLYMGEAERPPTDDTLPYRGVWTAEQASVAYDVYGRDMQRERMPYCERVYDEAGAAARFEVYDDTGHSYSPTIIRDVIAFHRASLGLTDLGLSRPTIGDRRVAVDAFAASDDVNGSVVLHVYGEDGTELTTESVALPPDTPTETTVSLARPVGSGEEITAAVVPEGGSREAAVATDTAVATARVAVTDRIVDGDSSVRLSYELASEASGPATLSVVPAGEGPFYSRRIRLRRVRPGESDTETFSLETDATGVPFEAGERVQVWLIPGGNQVPERAVATAEPTVADPPGSVAFASPPADGTSEVTVRYALADWYGQTASVRLTTESGSETLRESVIPGTHTTESIAVPSEFTPLARGERIGVRLVGDGTTLAETTTVVARESLASVSTQSVFGGAESLTVRYEVTPAVGEELTVAVRDATGASVAAKSITVGVGESGEVSVPLVDPATVGDEYTVRLVGSKTTFASDSRLVRRIESADVSFAELPAADEASVVTTVQISGEFPDDRGRLRLFPDEGGGRYGIGLDFLDRGTETTETYELDRPLGEFGLGTGVELRLYPSDWSYVDDVVALDRSTISGIQLADEVRPGDESVTLSYAVPESTADGARLRVTVGGRKVTELPVEPGGSGDRQVTLDPSPTAGDQFVVEIRTDSDRIVSTERTVTPQPASVSFTEPPSVRGTSLGVSAGLDESYDATEPVDLRLYTTSGSDFGTRLGSVEPGTQTTETFEVDPREGEVPFDSDETVRLAVVDGDDPYATAPLATAETSVGASVSNGTDTPTETTATPTDTPTNTPTDTSTDTPTGTPTDTQTETTEPSGTTTRATTTGANGSGSQTANDATSTTGSLGDWVPIAALAGAAGYLLRRGTDDESE